MLWSEAGLSVCWFWASWEELLWRPRSAAAYNWPGATWEVLQSDLQSVAACAEPGDTWERPYCKLKLAVTVLGLGHLSKSSGHPESCPHLSAAHKAQPLTELQVVCKLDEVGSQGESRVGQVMFNRLMQI